jgi:hypothetical protein
MTMKSLLLGAAAGIATLGAAQAADLPMTKAEPVEYVKVCSTFGPGFFYIPGTDTCLKIGGEIRADYRAYGNTKHETRDVNRVAFQGEGRIWFDARTDTDWGLLRSYFQINADGYTYSKTGNGKSNNFAVDKAFIQFGGLTAGFAHSFFGYYDNFYGDTIFGPYYAESSTVNLLAYTAQFGGGFSATLSIEDGREHRIQGSSVENDGLTYGGQQYPDVVGVLALDQGWGYLQASGAIHQWRSSEADLTDFGVRKNHTGWAAGGTALIKLPFIDGGHFIVEGQYADGALEYLGASNTEFGTVDDEGFKNVTTTTLKSGKGWSIVGELGGNITPVLNAELVASYIETKATFLKIQEATVSANLTYTVVKGFTVAPEITWVYDKVKADNIKTTQDIIEGGIRLKRTF